MCVCLPYRQRSSDKACEAIPRIQQQCIPVLRVALVSWIIVLQTLLQQVSAQGLWRVMVVLPYMFYPPPAPPQWRRAWYVVLIVVNTFTHLQLLPKGGELDMWGWLALILTLLWCGGAYLWLSFNLLSVEGMWETGVYLFSLLSIFAFIVEHICFLYWAYLQSSFTLICSLL